MYARVRLGTVSVIGPVRVRCAYSSTWLRPKPYGLGFVHYLNLIMAHDSPLLQPLFPFSTLLENPSAF